MQLFRSVSAQEAHHGETRVTIFEPFRAASANLADLSPGGDARPLVREMLEGRRRRADRPGAAPNDKNGLAWTLLTCEPADLRDPETALRLALDACALTDYTNPNYLDTLALAQHLTGDTPAAIETEKKALLLLPPDAAGRRGYEDALARFEAELEEPDTVEGAGGG